MGVGFDTRHLVGESFSEATQEEGWVPCVVKKPHIDGDDALEGVLQEANVLAHIQRSMEELEQVYGRRSQHIVNFFGFCHTLPHVCIVLEFCNGGDLQGQLERMSVSSHAADTDALRMRLQWARQVASGMAFLHKFKVAHVSCHHACGHLGDISLGRWISKLRMYF